MQGGATEVLHVRGMSCASCAAGLERALAAVPGVHHASVSYAAERATVEVASDAVRAVIEARIRERGYEVVPAIPAEDEGGDRLLARLAITAFFAMAAMMPSAVVLLGVEAAGSTETARALALVSACLALPALVVGGAPIARRAVRSLPHPGMDLLVAAGALVTAGYSVVVLARGGHEVFFDTAAMIVTFAILGRVLESRARRRGVGAMRALDALLPQRAHRVAPAGEHEVAVDALQVGDRIRVRAGERVPIDGVVREGASLADAAVLTGEWVPRSVESGQSITAGLLLLDGSVVVEVERGVGRREIDLVRRSVDALLASRAPMQRLADALAARLAWIVLGLAVLTLVGTGLTAGFGVEAWMRAAAVVVVACPCALGLATPMAIAVSAGHAASRGILFRDAEAIEVAASIDRVLVDKTGTLTEGRPHVTSVETSLDRHQVLGVVSLLEGAVRHPIAEALRSAAAPADLRLDVEVRPGAGVIGRGDATWIVGCARFLRARGVPVPGEDDGTTVHVARDGEHVARIGLDDALRPQVPDAITALVQRGLRPVLVTGDARAAAEHVARVAGIADVHAEVTPLEKAAIVRASRASGARVAFVGDGLNDGPALAASDLGVAVAGATDLAAECARVVLVEGGVERAVEALALARSTRRRMRQNLGWALVYNAIAIPAAALGWMSPGLAAAAMAASSLSVVVSSMRSHRGGEVAS